MTKDGKLLASRKQEWQPQKKWTIYCVSYSHQDLGFGDYPHRLRTSIRHENIRTPLRFCRETDAWPHDDQYRFNTPPPARAWATLESVSGAGMRLAQDLPQSARGDVDGIVRICELTFIDVNGKDRPLTELGK